MKSSDLNSEVPELPFSLNLKLKKSFAHHWKKPKNISQTPSVSQPKTPSQEPHPKSEYVHELFPQHHHQAPQQVADIDPHSIDFVKQIESMKAELEKIVEESLKDYAELDKAKQGMLKFVQNLKILRVKVIW